MAKKRKRVPARLVELINEVHGEKVPREGRPMINSDGTMALFFYRYQSPDLFNEIDQQWEIGEIEFQLDKKVDPSDFARAYQNLMSVHSQQLVDLNIAYIHSSAASLGRPYVLPRSASLDLDHAKNLRRLSLSSLSFNDKSLAKLRGHKHLKVVHLSKCTLGKGVASNLLTIKSLEIISISGCKALFSKKQRDALLKLPKIRAVNIR